MILRNFKRFAGLVGPLQTASYVQYAVFKEHYAQRVDLPHLFRKNAECMTDCLPVY
jgi:hypothetical protein